MDTIEQVAQLVNSTTGEELEWLMESFVDQLSSDVEDEFTGTPQQVSEWVLDEFKSYVETLSA